MAPKRPPPEDPKATLTPMVLVAGDTFAVKDQLKALGGGAWSMPHSGWVFPEEKRADIEAILKTGGIEVTAQGLGDAVAKPVVVVSNNAGANLTVSKHKKAILVTGDTAEVRKTRAPCAVAYSPLKPSAVDNC